MEKVAFLGLGVMGRGMAARLIRAGFEVTVWNRSPDRAEPVRQIGARLAPTPREAAAGAGIIVAMVADDGASRAVWTEDGGALAGAAEGTLAIDCSTLSPTWVAELAESSRRAGLSFLDAPVLGSRSQAANGEIVFLVGGESRDVERARPLLRAMGRDAVHLGPTGSGARMKLINNFLGAVQATALAEALAWIKASNLDQAAAMNVLYNGAPGSPLVKTVGPRMTARDYTVNFMLSLMRKDVAYARAEAGAHGITLRTAEPASDLFDAAIAAGFGQLDFSAVAEVAGGDG